jgi:signal transduction histidine kinase/CheY-like chemotaxis protein
MGFISLSSVLPGFFNEEIINLGREVANQVAIAITQNRLFEDLRNLNAKLEQRVTERTAELHQSNVELEHANHAKDEFLANMSHELRTPLNSILGLSETLLEQRRDPISEYQQRSLQIIHSSGSHLLELINDILDLSKIEAGKFDHYPQIISVSELCRSSLAFVKAQAVSKSIALTYQEGMDVSRVYADPRRLKQILVNLLTNAVKFTPIHGQVTLEVHSEPEQDRIHFSVIDTGIGIALEDLRQLFVPFKQVDSSLNRDYEGTGLGLALVQKLTDLHGGSVDVKSEVGRGSRFTINLPLAQAMLAQQEVDETGGERVLSEQAGKSNTSSDEPLDHGIVLLAEDNMANVLTISDYLESHGYEVVVAHDGLEAIEKAEETKPDIILMDIQMPALDGLEATRRLRANPSFASTPIIALTALAMRGDRERCLEAGANEYMSKPVGLKMLLSTVRNLLAKKSK